MEQMSLDQAPIVDERAARRAEQDRENHRYSHTHRPLASCQLCRDAHNASRSVFSYASRCKSVGFIYEGQYERQNGSGAWARGTCPTCQHRVGITRPTKSTPWPLVGAHRP